MNRDIFFLIFYLLLRLRRHPANSTGSHFASGHRRGDGRRRVGHPAAFFFLRTFQSWNVNEEDGERPLRRRRRRRRRWPFNDDGCSARAHQKREIQFQKMEKKVTDSSSPPRDDGPSRPRRRRVWTTSFRSSRAGLEALTSLVYSDDLFLFHQPNLTQRNDEW